MSQHGAVAADERYLRLNFDVLPVLSKFRMGFYQLAQQFGNIDRGQRQILSKQRTITQHIANELVHAERSGPHPLKIAMLGLAEPAAGLLFDQLSECDDCAQWSAHIMHHAVGDLLQLRGCFSPGALLFYQLALPADQLLDSKVASTHEISYLVLWQARLRRNRLRFLRCLSVFQGRRCGCMNLADLGDAR